MPWIPYLNEIESSNGSGSMEHPEQILETDATPALEEDGLIQNLDPELKMWAVVRRDLNMSGGKLVPQAGHAFLDCGLQADRALLELYQATSKAKISLRVKSEAQLLRLHGLCVAAGLNTCLVRDAGKTFFDGEPTYTMFAVGPCYRHELPRPVDKLPML